jgi:hypothetical protein
MTLLQNVSSYTECMFTCGRQIKMWVIKMSNETYIKYKNQ